MCLHTIDKKTKQYKKGYKEFQKDSDGKLYPDCMPTATVGQRYYPVNQWLRDERKHPKTIQTLYNDRYPCGFHFYKEPGLFRRKIKVRNVVASGWQNGDKVGVAKEIFIPYP